MSTLPIIFDYAAIEKRVNLLKKVLVDDDIDTGRTETIPAKQKMPINKAKSAPGKATLVDDLDDLDAIDNKLPKKAKNSDKIVLQTALDLIDVQLRLSDNLPITKKYWREIRRLVSNWWGEDDDD